MCEERDGFGDEVSGSELRNQDRAFGMEEPICGSFGIIDMQMIDLTAGIHHSPRGTAPRGEEGSEWRLEYPRDSHHDQIKAPSLPKKGDDTARVYQRTGKTVAVEWRRCGRGRTGKWRSCQACLVAHPQMHLDRDVGRLQETGFR
jgi:hypothetical protein